MLDNPEMELVAVNVADQKKGEKIILLLAKDSDGDNLRKMLIEADTNPLMLPAEILTSQEIPKLGSDKTYFRVAKRIVLEKM